MEPYDVIVNQPVVIDNVSAILLPFCSQVTKQQCFKLAMSVYRCQKRYYNCDRLKEDVINFPFPFFFLSVSLVSLGSCQPLLKVVDIGSPIDDFDEIHKLSLQVSSKIDRVLYFCFYFV